jgi:hypothetical protein
MASTRQIHAQLDEKLAKRIDEVATARDWSFSQAVRVLLREGLNSMTEWDGERFVVGLSSEESKEFNRG